VQINCRRIDLSGLDRHGRQYKLNFEEETGNVFTFNCNAKDTCTGLAEILKGQNKPPQSSSMNVKFNDDCTGTLISSTHILTSAGCLHALGSKVCDQDIIKGTNPKNGQKFAANLIAIFGQEPIQIDSMVIAVMDKEIEGINLPELKNIPIDTKNFIASKIQAKFNYLVKRGEMGIVFGKYVNSPWTLNFEAHEGSKMEYFNCPISRCGEYELNVNAIMNSGSLSSSVDCGGKGAHITQTFKEGSKSRNYDSSGSYDSKKCKGDGSFVQTYMSGSYSQSFANANKTCTL